MHLNSIKGAPLKFSACACAAASGLSGFPSVLGPEPVAAVAAAVPVSLLSIERCPA